MRAAVIGGDMRMIYAAEAFKDSSINVALAGFEKTKLHAGLDKSSLDVAVKNSDFIVLPIRPENNGYLNAPFSERDIMLEELSELVGKRPVFSGFADSIAVVFDSHVYDYSKREEFAVYNAALTAEAAVSIAIEEYSGAILGSKILVLGYGRIGRILSRYLRALGAEVTSAVRGDTARAWARVEGVNTTDYSSEEISDYVIIFNTVPSVVLDKDKVSRIKQDSIIIDLASAPGGVDKKAAENRGIKLIHALALPGKTSPKAAGEIIKDTIINIIKEENGGKDNLGLRDDGLLLHL